jgi:hypothetical protein
MLRMPATRTSDVDFDQRHRLRARSRTTRSGAVEVMQRNFGKTIDPDGDDGGSDTDRRITHHFAVFPRSRAHVPAGPNQV